MNIKDNIVFTETLYSSSVTLVRRGVYQKSMPVVVKNTAQDVPDGHLIEQYKTSYLAQQKVDHPAVNGVIEYVLDGAGCSLLLEDIGGKSLDSWIIATLKEYSCWPLEIPDLFHLYLLRLLRWSITLAEGIAAFHLQDVIHNDINPANITVNPETDQIQVIDFGGAFPDGSNINDWTVVNRYRALTYISPEQTGRLNRNIDYRSDYYAFGATLYQLFSGKRPFVAKDLPELIHCHIARHPEKIDSINPLLPASLSALIMKLMAKAPEDRYQNGRCLIQDLKAIELAVKTGIPLSPLELGENDVPEKLLIPTKLYGREQELLVLKESLCDPVNKPALITVEGDSGSGKTSLVNESILHFVDQSVQVLSGKSEVYNKRPHIALSQALEKSVDFLMSLPDKEFSSWRSLLLDELSQNPYTLISLCPELSQVFETANVADKGILHDAEIQLKLHTAIYLRHLSKIEPVLLLIDDVQWCDAPSFSLLEALIKANYPRLTIMFTCRCEELDKRHLYVQLKNSVREEGIGLTEVFIGGLNRQQIFELLNATFHNANNDYEDLAGMLLKKTLGNPLFVGEFLRAAHQRGDGALFYDYRKGRWLWDKEKLEQVATSGNVTALLIESLHYQNQDTQNILKWAACIGSKFGEELLSSVTGISESRIRRYLSPAYRRGYICRVSGKKNLYVFNHDRIRQAYFELQNIEDIAERNWLIGMTLLNVSNRNYGDPLPHLYEALCSTGGDFFPSNENLKMFVSVFSKGAQKAKDKAEYDLALQYVNCTIKLLEKYKESIDEESNFYDEKIGSSFLLQGSLAYLLRDRSLAESAFHNYRDINDDPIHQASSYAQQTPLVCVLGDFDASINYSLKCFELLGIESPKSGKDLSLKIEEQWLMFGDADGFSEILGIENPVFVDSISLSTIQSVAANMVLICATKNQFQWAEWFGLVGINSFVNGGLTPYFAQLMGLFDCVLYSSKRSWFSKDMASMACLFVDEDPSLPGSGFVYSTKGTYGGRYSLPMEKCIEFLDIGAECSLSKGEYLGYLACLSNKVVISFSAGVSLVTLQQYADELKDFLVSCGEFVSVGKHYYRLLCQLIDVEVPDYLDESQFSKKQWDTLKNSVAYGAYFHLKLQRNFWRAEYITAISEYRLNRSLLETVRGFSIGDDNHFIHAISCLQNTSFDNPISINEALIDADESIEHINGVAEVYPKNFQHKALLIKAETQRLMGDSTATATYLSAAIDAKENGFIQMYALAHELHASYWKEQGRPDYVKYHIEKALKGYRRWGCGLKVEQINRRFDEFIHQHMPYEFQDQKKLLKISNELVEELDLNQKLGHIVGLVLTFSGAEQGWLLLKCGDQYVVQAMACVTEGEGFHVERYEAKEGSLIINKLPMELINSCALSKQPLLIEDIAKGLDWQNGLINHLFELSSLLCYPVVHKGECQSLILLTHSKSNVFTLQNRQLIQSLTPQIAVSIENSQLYQKHQEFNVALEQKVTQRTLELRAANEELRAFTASVSHDLRAPLRAIIGFTGALSEDFNQCLGEKGGLDAKQLIDESQNMREVIDGLILLSRSAQSGLKREEVNLSTLVGDKLRWLRIMESSHEVIGQVQQGLIARGDLVLLKQVVDNLITNSWKFSHDVEAPAISFGMLATSKSQHTFYVRDNGVGFDAENAGELFSPFRRFHKGDAFEGSGIGLATVYRIIKRHGGEIWVESEVNQGAIFYFTLNASST